MKIPHILVFLIGALLCQSLSAQTPDERLEIADQYFNAGNYSEAGKIYQEVLRSIGEHPKVRFMNALTMLYSKQNRSIALEEMLKVGSGLEGSELRYEYLFNLGKAYHLNLRFDDALNSLEKVVQDANPDLKLKEDAAELMRMCTQAKLMVKKPVKVSIENLGSEINSPAPDYGAVISADESVMIFTSKRNTGGKNTSDGWAYEDVYISHRVNEKWSSATSVGMPINTDDHEACMGLSADGETFLFYRSAKSKDGDIYSTRRSGKGWHPPDRLGNTVNSKFTEFSASLSADGLTLYFSSDREGGFGGRDLYKSERQSNGQWGVAINLGASVNTAGNEDAPFIHPDNQTLYFSSEGHTSMGGYDIFKSVFRDKAWSVPENLGFPISTPEDDVHFVLNASGKTAYYSTSWHKGLGAEDIFSVKMPEANIPLTMVRGTVVTKGKKPSKIDIKVIDKESNNQLKYVYNPDPETGKYLMIFPPGKNYDMIVEAEGYDPYVFNIHIPNQSYFYQMHQTMYLRTIEVLDDTLGKGITIENTFEDLMTSEDRALLEERRQDELKRRDEMLLALIEEIIETADSGNYLGNQNEEEKDYAPLLSLIEKVIEYTDSTALENIEKITASGFFEKSDEQIMLLNAKGAEMEPYPIGKDTIYVIKRMPEETAAPKVKILEKHEEIVVRSVLAKILYFETAKSEIGSQYLSDLDRIAEAMIDFPRWQAEVAGFTDDVGSDEVNMKVSLERARAVKNYLMSKGVEKNRIQIVNYGKAKPSVPNSNEEARSKNRRAEITIRQAVLKESTITE